MKFLKRYSPETKVEKRKRLTESAEKKITGKSADGKKPVLLKFGLNHITTLIENRQVCI